tara:strand:+ start:586 stop:1548 length:963 start_codon:yes stop_codon:yes gene_type:complete
MNALFSPSETTLLLNDAELQRLRQAVESRRSSLYRGRLLLSLHIGEVSESFHGDPTTPPANASRLLYQWEGSTHWQATAWDEAGTLLCDIVSDGEWIEAGGRRWSWKAVAMTDTGVGGNVVPETLPTDDQLSEVLTFLSHLWPQTLATGHLGLTGPPDEDGFQQLDGVYRNTSSDTLLWHVTVYDPSVLQVRVGRWRWLQWLWARWTRPDLTFDEFFRVPNAEIVHEAIFEVDAAHLYPIACRYVLGGKGGLTPNAGAQEWREPVLLENGIHLPRACVYYDAAYNGSLRYQSELILGECHIGSNAKLSIRPINMDTPVVA